MRVKIFTFRYSTTLGGFDDRPLSEFVRDKAVLSFREHFFQVNDIPHLACVVTYQEAIVARERNAAARPAEPAIELAEPERILYNTLREWRSKTAREEGVPPYVLFNNRQLAEIVRRRPESPTALSNVPGIGAAKVKRYGQAILELLHGKAVPEAAP